ncbi:nitrous oxide reductase accessory protein NosL [Planococcus sp. ISL-110]|uniref:nitrous oxide reductase accessory protein NosL n=1 Tax=Planococcus sp. ISL-110 TaxID=2819167 RepID=UPI001BE5C985|nr:nitrous oxide reductase accessory protein NosL [Planococcus sp. ISL-110]MBT2571157.1 hypothetical protein [Planococcus sp. ISL-110]
MKKLLFAVPLVLSLYACGDESVTETDKQEVEQQEVEQQEVDQQEKVSTDSEKVWAVDERLQEPTEDTVCEMCNMKVYMKDDELGIFSAQAVKADGAVVFYDDIGCLLNDEYVNKSENEKFVRDYTTLNWFKVEEAIIVKTDLKSPMNWGYIFFKYQDDADAYIAEHTAAAVTPLDQVRAEGIERHKKKQEKSESSHSHSSEESDTGSDMDMGKDKSSEGSHE